MGRSFRTGATVAIDGHNGRDTYKVLHVFPTKSHADGPLPSTLLKLVRAGGGAAFVRLLAARGEKATLDSIVGAGYSRPLYYVIALNSSGDRDGFPVWLKPHQVKRIREYLR